jgi:hypothetical protein
MWPALESALSGIDRDGDVDGDGFVEWQRQAPSGVDVTRLNGSTSVAIVCH